MSDEERRDPEPELGPIARAEIQRFLDREAQRMLEEGYRNGPDGHLVPPQEKPER